MRELTQNDVQWTWGTAQEASLEALKKAVISTPVLRYYNLKKEVTLQCDASQFGLGATLLQNGQPVAYASRALTDTETRYAQIEKRNCSQLSLRVNVLNCTLTVVTLFRLKVTTSP